MVTSINRGIAFVLIFGFMAMCNLLVHDYYYGFLDSTIQSTSLGSIEVQNLKHFDGIFALQQDKEKTITLSIKDTQIIVSIPNTPAVGLPTRDSGHEFTSVYKYNFILNPQTNQFNLIITLNDSTQLKAERIQ